MSVLSQNMTLMPGVETQAITWLPPYHHSPLHRGYINPSPSNHDCCSFCSSSSCSDSKMTLSMKGERLASKNKAHELNIRRHSMTALQKPASGKRCCLQRQPGWCSTSSFAGHRNRRISFFSFQDKLRNCFQIHI